MLKDTLTIGAYYVTEAEGIIRILKHVDRVGDHR